MISRRGLLRGLLAAPVIIRTPGLLMPVKPLLPPPGRNDIVMMRIIGRDQFGREVEEYAQLNDVWQAQRQFIEVSGIEILNGAELRQATLLRLHEAERRIAASFRQIG